MGVREATTPADLAAPTPLRPRPTALRRKTLRAPRTALCCHGHLFAPLAAPGRSKRGPPMHPSPLERRLSLTAHEVSTRHPHSLSLCPAKSVL